MAVAGSNDGPLSQSLLKNPVIEVADLSSDDVESATSYDEAVTGKLDLGDSDDWSMFEDALAQEEENDNDERPAQDSGRFCKVVDLPSATDTVFQHTFSHRLKLLHTVSASVR